MTNRPQTLLEDMKLAAEFVVSAVANRQREDIHENLMLRFAIERELITVGEALNQLHQIAPEVAEHIHDWKKVIDFRNILVHGYKVLDEDIIWDISKTDVPRLIEKLTELINYD